MSLCSEKSFFTTSQKCDLVCRRGFSPRAQHAVRIWNRIHATRRVRKEKKQMSIRISYVINFGRIFKFLQSFSFYMKSLQQFCCFSFFCFFSTSVLFRILNSLWRSCANPYPRTRFHFWDVAKKAPSEDKDI